ncbi:MAG: DNA-processing protein DprA [Defluviitaleaceae bacterium]|nr:DNA-processing protein DprA [Defluviitaleaceae bacterium]
MHNDIYMLWLSSLAGHIDSRKLNFILDTFGTARNAFFANPSEFERASRLTPQAAKMLNERRSLEYIENLLGELEKRGIAYFSRENERFPSELREIPDPPVGIFCMGTLPPDDTPMVAVIGSRKCSEYGLMAARVFAKPLAEAGIVIVSGMARGVDSMAHRGAISGGGKTIAVLGCGVDVCYPAENLELRDQIAANGCVISEYPPGTKPQAYFFPARNRIISGLSRGVLVTEAGKKSGTLITVNQATEQGREVFAVPGNISSRLSEGTNDLIRDGAIPVSDHTDIMFALKISPPKKSSNSGDKSHEKKIALAPDEKQVYDTLSFDPVSVETLMEAMDFSPGTMMLLLARLEIKGLVRKMPGSRYIKT